MLKIFNSSFGFSPLVMGILNLKASRGFSHIVESFDTISSNLPQDAEWEDYSTNLTGKTITSITSAKTQGTGAARVQYSTTAGSLNTKYFGLWIPNERLIGDARYVHIDVFINSAPSGATAKLYVWDNDLSSITGQTSTTTTGSWVTLTVDVRGISNLDDSTVGIEIINTVSEGVYDVYFDSLRYT